MIISCCLDISRLSARGFGEVSFFPTGMNEITNMEMEKGTTPLIQRRCRSAVIGSCPNVSKHVWHQNKIGRWCAKCGVQTVVSLTVGFTMAISVLLVTPSAHHILHTTLSGGNFARHPRGWHTRQHLKRPAPSEARLIRNSTSRFHQLMLRHHILFNFYSSP